MDTQDLEEAVRGGAADLACFPCVIQEKDVMGLGGSVAGMLCLDEAGRYRSCLR